MDYHFTNDARSLLGLDWFAPLQAPRPLSEHWMHKGFLEEILWETLQQREQLPAWVALENGFPVGLLAVTDGEILLMAVKRSHQRQGIGRSLVEHAWERDGDLFCHVSIYPLLNLGWISFLERLGGRFDPVDKHSFLARLVEGVSPLPEDPFVVKLPQDWSIEDGLAQIHEHEIER